jgi:uncharacterized protein
MYIRPTSKHVKLLIMQPTPFCNVDCAYCYLPDRGNRSAMRLDDLAAILNRLTADRIFSDQLSLCWHAGEPLVVGIDFYREAQGLLQTCLPGGIRLTQAVQTNGTLIDERWCNFFREHDIRVGLSLDGPKQVHDRNRVTRSGAGTYERVVRALELLQAAGIKPYVICVVDRQGLESVREIYDFFAGRGLDEVCFNIEETEGINISDALDRADLKQTAKALFGTLLVRVQDTPSGPWVRELHNMFGRIAAAMREPDGELASDLTEPFDIVTVAYDGRWSTFSPELSGIKNAAYGDFFFGKLLHESLDAGVARPAFQPLLGEIRAGVAKCRERCGYFRICGGGSPSNKWAEKGTFDTTETGHCQSWTQGLADACLDFVEGLYGTG